MDLVHLLNKFHMEVKWIDLTINNQVVSLDNKLKNHLMELLKKMLKEEKQLIVRQD